MNRGGAGPEVALQGGPRHRQDREGALRVRTLRTEPHMPRRKLRLSCMGMGFSHGPPKGRPEMIAPLRAALERGVTSSDTAEVDGSYLN